MVLTYSPLQKYGLQWITKTKVFALPFQYLWRGLSTYSEEGFQKMYQDRSYFIFIELFFLVFILFLC